MSSIQKLLAAMVLVTSLVLLATPKAAGQNSMITALVTDNQGRPQANVDVYLYDGTPACVCGPGNICGLISAGHSRTGVNGRTLPPFMGLMNNHGYTVCIHEQCRTIGQACQNPANDCQHIGNCQAVTTRRNGGVATVQIIQ